MLIDEAKSLKATEKVAQVYDEKGHVKPKGISENKKTLAKLTDQLKDQKIICEKNEQAHATKVKLKIVEKATKSYADAKS